jgi:hypothetical protein
VGLELAKAFVTIRADGSMVVKDLKQTQAPATNAAKGIAVAVNRALATIGIGVGVAAMISKMQQLISLAERQIQAEQRVAAVVRATGGAAGFTADQLRKQAAALQQVTTVGDEAILEAQAIILTFRNITGKAFEETTELAFDLAQVMGQDVRSGALQLAKALEDPIRGVTALRRSGVSFNEQQREQIKLLVESSRLNEAQALILETVRGQIGGVAKAMAQTDAGKLQQARNVLGDMREELGRKLIPVQTQFVELQMKLTRILEPLIGFVSRNIDVLATLAAGFITLKVAIMGVKLALSGPGGFLGIMALVAGTAATWALLSNQIDDAAEHTRKLKDEWQGVKDEITAATSNFKDFTSEQAKAARKKAEQKLSEAQLKVRQLEVTLEEKRAEIRKRAERMGVSESDTAKLLRAAETGMTARFQKATAAVTQAQAALNLATRGPKKPDYPVPGKFPVGSVIKDFLGGIGAGLEGTIRGLGAAAGVRDTIGNAVAKGIETMVGQLGPGAAEQFRLRFAPEQGPLIGAGRHGFRDFGRSIQDALLQRQDPMLKLTQQEISEIKNTNRLLGTISNTLSGGLGGIPMMLSGPS